MKNVLEKKDLLLSEKVKLTNQVYRVQEQLNIEEENRKILKKQISDLEVELLNMRGQIKVLQAEKNKYRNSFRTIEHSRIWQYSKSIRDISLVIKRVLGIKNHSPRRNEYKKSSVSLKQSNIEISDEKKVKNAKGKVKQIKRKLLNLGFEERAYKDLIEMLSDTKDVHLKKFAAWELALWHGNKYTKEDAKKCLEFLSVVIKEETDSSTIRKAKILVAECQEILGQNIIAKKELERLLTEETHPDLLLGKANNESNYIDKIRMINEVYKFYKLLELDIANMNKELSLENIKIIKDEGKVETEHYAKVTVIMPIYNSENYIETAIRSVLSQSWHNLEVIIVDDCSTDNTFKVVESFLIKDSRVKLLQTKVNSGPYVARNLALDVATGDFITCHDADDWSHPQKIEKQVLHLVNNPNIMGNTSQQVRASTELKFHRRGKPGVYIFDNMSSLMFRRKDVLEQLGYWDSVRFMADGEFIRRFKKKFGELSIKNLKTGPLSFQRQTSTSLTGNKVFGFHGNLIGARLEYFESSNYFHSKTDSLRYEFPQKLRPFAVPEPLIKNKKHDSIERRHFDIILVSDFRLHGGSNMSNVEEIIAQKQLGIKVGLIQMNRYDLDPKRSFDSKVRNLVDGDQVQVIVFGEYVSCDLLIVRYPPILQERQRFIPDVKANNIRVIINQPPQSDYGPNAVIRYDIKRANHYLQECFGKGAIWCPIGPLVRDVLYEYHREELKEINLSKENWSNIIDVDKWERKSRPINSSKKIIGRHSRDNEVKWPENPAELLGTYPDSEDYEVHILGGGETPKKVLGYLPDNWNVSDFGAIHPKKFLEKLDVFVYYTHSDWVESFGRVIIEAMAVGVPVILPHSYRKLFEEAAIYAEPFEVKYYLEKLLNNENFYNEKVLEARKYVEKHFGYTMHARRIQKFIDRKLQLPNKEKNREGLISNLKRAEKSGNMIGYVEKIIEEKKCFERSYSEALILAAKKIKKSEIRNEIHQKIISSLKVGELPEFLVKSSGKGDKLSLRSISSFRASLSMRSRKRQLSTILPEWILDDKVRSYAFVDKLGIDRPLIFNSHIKFSEIDKGEKIVIKPVSGAGSRGVYLVENSDNILDVRNSKLLGGWKSLEFSIRNDLKNGLVKNDDWIVEELIYNENSLEKPSRDIKFYCFYGKVALILEVRRYPSKGYCWWSASGELVNTGKYDDKVIQGDGVSKKEIDLAAAMSSEIPAPFVRLDFHKSSERLVFGEFTPRPGNYEKFDEKTDQLLGDYFLEAEGRLMDDLIGGKKFEYFNQFLNEIDINS